MTRRALFLLASLALITFAMSGSGLAAPEEPRRPAVECTERGGLPNVLAKLTAGGEVHIAYLGGSITEAAPGWRGKSLKWFQETYPSAKVSEISAGIGGTGSDLGAFRVGHDVLQHKPDLLFIEFAVNDAESDPERIQACMEGIVRQTWKANPLTDICFVYTLSLPYLPEMKSGHCNRSSTAMEGVADRYAIPTLNFGVEVARLEKEGKLIFQGNEPKNLHEEGKPMIFSEDGVHPFGETGHELYLQTIVRSVAKLDKVSSPGPHPLPAPLRPDNLENATMVPIDAAMAKGAWTQLDPTKDNPARVVAKFVPSLWEATEAGATIEFTCKGMEASAYGLLGPDCGKITIQVDDNPPTTIPCFDSYCTYHRLDKFYIFDTPTPTTHRVRITLTADTFDKAKILFPKDRPDLAQHPERYAGYHCYIGGLLLDGTLEKSGP